MTCSHGGTTGSSTTLRRVARDSVPRSCAEPADPSCCPRDKLARLLVVGVRCCGRPSHGLYVGGILIGSDTDPTIFDGALAEIVAGEVPLPLAVVSTRKAGGCPGWSLIGETVGPRTAQANRPAGARLGSRPRPANEN